MVATPIRKRDTAGFFARKLAINQIVMETIMVQVRKPKLNER